MTDYYEQGYEESSQHRRHARRRRKKKARLIMAVLGAVCVMIGLIMAGIGLYLDQSPADNRWVHLGGGYIVGGIVLFLARALLTERRSRKKRVRR
jgi:low temperature requirement protein LtrA